MLRVARSLQHEGGVPEEFPAHVAGRVAEHLPGQAVVHGLSLYVSIVLAVACLCWLIGCLYTDCYLLFRQ